MSAHLRLRRVLVANRGEIAVRIIRAAHAEGLQAVVAVSDADRDAMPARLADRSVCIGPAPAAESYLDVDRVIAAAQAADCDAVHPGYGFLAERPELAEACARHGLVFVGPSAQAIRRGGDKAAARALAASLAVPVGRGSGILTGRRHGEDEAERMGFPVLVKAAAGGGGRGMAVVRARADLAVALERASAEAAAAFGDGRVYLEHFVDRARHVEVQVLADAHGEAVHLGERDCSVQRRYQKLIEEAPAPDLDESVRVSLHSAALRLIRALDYVGAATVEFVLDVETGEIGFLEVNTRVQVEHPVTEMVTGLDIVREQLRLAAGAELSIRQPDVMMNGHAIEARVNAEDPGEDFAPRPGTITAWTEPTGDRVRVDTHCFAGYRIPPHYDSLLAKVIAIGPDRDAARAELVRALGQLRIEGVPTTAGAATAILTHPDFAAVRHHTRWWESAGDPHPPERPTSAGNLGV